MMAATSAAIVLALLALYGVSGVLSSFWHDVISFPVDAYVRTRSLPLPPIKALWEERRLLPVVVYLPPLACVAGVLTLLRHRVPNARQLSSTPDHGALWMVCLLIPMTALFYLKGFARLGTDQLQLSLLASIPLLAMAWHLAYGQRRERTFLAFVWFVNAACAAAFSHLGATREDMVYQDVFRGVMHSRPSVESERQAALRYVVSHSSDFDRLFVGLTRHDKLVMNDVSAYFLSRRIPATKWHQFDPGLQTSARIQLEMIRDLQEHKPKLVWIESSFDWIVEPNDSALSSGVTALDDYLRSRYEPAAGFGTIHILKRRLE
jgi:hypothetical protein